MMQHQMKSRVFLASAIALLMSSCATDPQTSPSPAPSPPRSPSTAAPELIAGPGSARAPETWKPEPPATYSSERYVQLVLRAYIEDYPNQWSGNQVDCRPPPNAEESPFERAIREFWEGTTTKQTAIGATVAWNANGERKEIPLELIATNSSNTTCVLSVNQSEFVTPIFAISQNRNVSFSVSLNQWASEKLSDDTRKMIKDVAVAAASTFLPINLATSVGTASDAAVSSQFKSQITSKDTTTLNMNEAINGVVKWKALTLADGKPVYVHAWLREVPSAFWGTSFIEPLKATARNVSSSTKVDGRSMGEIVDKVASGAWTSFRSAGAESLALHDICRPVADALLKNGFTLNDAAIVVWAMVYGDPNKGMMDAVQRLPCIEAQRDVLVALGAELAPVLRYPTPGEAIGGLQSIDANLVLALRTSNEDNRISHLNQLFTDKMSYSDDTLRIFPIGRHTGQKPDWKRHIKTLPMFTSVDCLVALNATSNNPAVAVAIGTFADGKRATVLARFAPQQTPVRISDLQIAALEGVEGQVALGMLKAELQTTGTNCAALNPPAPVVTPKVEPEVTSTGSNTP